MIPAATSPPPSFDLTHLGLTVSGEVEQDDISLFEKTFLRSRDTLTILSIIEKPPNTDPTIISFTPETDPTVLTSALETFSRTKLPHLRNGTFNFRRKSFIPSLPLPPRLVSLSLRLSFFPTGLFSSLAEATPPTLLSLRVEASEKDIKSVEKNYEPEDLCPLVEDFRQSIGRDGFRNLRQADLPRWFFRGTGPEVVEELEKELGVRVFFGARYGYALVSFLCGTTLTHPSPVQEKYLS